ncbi:MAG: bifunctional 3,4-dihydroxy-2-butanone-4-phosphate synthase/GTP cyclohydrolase II [Verrucomicrobia bacterium]|nr:bifunctional 3,4-dihydroxy-2-butanone-4-phosphate synthase/GTP cyclohydrolase II [Verrucomicrobiota bacterium]
MTDTQKTESCFDPLDDVIAAFSRGEIVVITDDEKRENEGDLVCAAECVTPETINFMATHGKGLICIALEESRLKKLGLSRMGPHSDRDQYRTAWMESVDAAEGITTGISAQDRARTIAVLLDEASTPSDLMRPGHLFPLQAVEEGVLRRAGHTEAAVDLAGLAGLKRAGVICEILREDGTMARMPDLVVFAKKHGLKVTSVADIAAHRFRTEQIVKRESTAQLPTKHGIFNVIIYYSFLEDKEHLALVLGNPEKQNNPLVRVHSECLTGDVFGSMRCDCGTQLAGAMEMIGKEGHGVLVYMRQEGRGIGLRHKIHAYALQDSGLDTVEANEKLGFDADLRDYGVTAQILTDLKLDRIRLITNNPKKISGLERYGISVTKRVPLVLPTTEHNERYLETKKTKLGHWL